MAPTTIRLDEALTAVVNEAHQRCSAALSEGGLLESATAVVKGARARSRPDPPYLWVAVAGAEPTHARAIHETWEVALMLSAVVQSETPHDGWLEAFQLAARARSLVLAGRRSAPPLGLTYVEDLQSGSMGPLGRMESGRRFGAFARIDVRLTLVEPELQGGNGNG